MVGFYSIAIADSREVLARSRNERVKFCFCQILLMRAVTFRHVD